MAMNADALLRIKASVTGVDQVSALGAKFGAVEKAANSLAGRVGVLSGAMGALVPLASIGGLTALIGRNIEAADTMNDLSQRTGVTVETLGKFRKAAALSGTDIDSVANSITKLSKGLYQFNETGKGGAGEALQKLGIDAKTANGEMKSADQIMIEVARRFEKMPDGIEKTALAMQLFGKSGAQMIPMLNMGGDALEKMGTKMTTAFAQKADEYNDKLAILSGKVNGLAMSLTIALIPALDLAVGAMTSVVDVFTKLPEPVQAIIGGLALLAIGFAALAPVLGLVVQGFAALASLQLGAVVAGWLGALTPFLTWLGATFVPAILAFFSGPVGWITLAVIAVGAMVYAFREPIMGFLGWMGEQLALVPGFFMGLGEQLKTWLGGLIESMRLAIDPFIQGFLQGTNDLLIAIQNAWNAAPQFFSDIWGRITQAVMTRINELKALGKGLADFFVSIPGRIATAFRTGFQAAINSIRGAINAVLRGAGNAINSFIQSVNNMIASINRISARVGISLSYIPTVAIPQFATGAFVDGPVIGRVGEKEDEYIIPASQMERATQNFQRGRRGAEVLNSDPGPSRGGPVNVSVNFSGQVIDLGDGRRAVTMDDVVGLLEANNAAIMDAMGEAPMQLAVRGF